MESTPTRPHLHWLWTDHLDIPPGPGIPPPGILVGQKTNHKVVWAKCGIKSCQVQIAKAAPCLPNTDKLTRSKDFWGLALQRYSTLTSGAITLETWTEFKKDILTLGMKVQRTTRKNRLAEWKAALQGDAIPLEELPAMLEAARRYTP